MKILKKMKKVNLKQVTKKKNKYQIKINNYLSTVSKAALQMKNPLPFRN